MSDFVFTVGAELPAISQPSNLVTSVMYAGASTDYNPLHYDQAFAGQVSPTGAPIAHGMYSMGLVSRMLTAAAGGPAGVCVGRPAPRRRAWRSAACAFGGARREPRRVHQSTMG